MARPTNPNLNIPAAFAVNGTKTDFTNEKLQSGFDDTNPDILAGDNLNKLIDDTYKGLNFTIDGVEDLYDVTDTNANAISAHVANTSNPHSVTKAQFGLGNVNNTSDANKPISTATQAALDNKASIDLSNLSVTGQAVIDNKANIALDNLSTAGSNRLHALKGYEENGTALTDSEGLADVTTYAHSTYDSTKFTVTGTPTITDDGIASGLDSSNYVKLTNSITLGTDFELYIPFTYPADASTVTSPNNCILRGQSGNTFRMLCSAYAGGYVDFNMSDGTNVLGTPHIIPSGVMNANESAIIVIKQKNQTCTYGYIKNGVYTQTGTKENFPLDMPEIDNFWFGRGSGTSGWVGQIDLKYIKIVKNGSELISGNITGIDTLKPDDYTVVGTPSISADGIASGLDSSNYITCDCINTDGTIYIPVPNIASGVGGTVVTGAYKIYKNSSWTNRFQLLIDTSNTSIWNSGSNFYNQETDKLLLKVVKKGYTYSVSYKLNNNDWVNVPDVTLSVNPTATMINFEGGYNVDLNLYKNVVNGSVINQPCLKIPYTLSADKYGSKIVDAAYRLRVQDAWEQNFKQRYYTLDEVNGNFTLPQGEIYGMINQKANYNEWVYADQSSALSTATAINSYDLTTALAALLPDDTASYECIFRYELMRGETGAGNNSRYYVYVKNDNIVFTENIDSLTASGDDTVSHSGQFTAIIDSTRYFKIAIENRALYSSDLYLVAYRKLS